MCILFGFNTFVLQQRLQAAHQDWGHIVLDTVQARVVTARRNHRANRGDRPGARGGLNTPPTSRRLEQELGSVLWAAVSRVLPSHRHPPLEEGRVYSKVAFDS